jgi:DNA-binding transcriptional MerR regulator
MPKKGFFSVSEFARYSRTSRDTLHFYDKIGLLSPAMRGENNYRYYFSRQLALVNVIKILQELGMSLTEIKNTKELRTPSLIDEIFGRQLEHIDAKIEEWVQARKLLSAYRKNIQSAVRVDEKKITVQFLPAEAIILGDINDYSRGRNYYDALQSFYRTAADKYPNLNLNYPVWGIFEEERIKRGEWTWPDRFYFFNPEGHEKRPASLYAIGYTRGGYGQCDELYRRIIGYINKNKYEICGDAYEEYPLNELCIADEKEYLIRVMITVREKKRPC